jgi:hypothetical protein
VRAHDWIAVTEMSESAMDVDRVRILRSALGSTGSLSFSVQVQLVLSWMHPLIDPGSSVFPSASATQARTKARTSSALLYAFFVLTVIRESQ